jgi:hypothetical protein
MRKKQMSVQQVIEKPHFINLRASDVSGQKLAEARRVPGDATVGELVSGLLTRMNLPRNDVNGRPLRYQARLERAGRHLLSSELVGESLQEDDRLTLQPNVDAGGAR